jgi:hypothetical protein
VANRKGNTGNVLDGFVFLFKFGGKLASKLDILSRKKREQEERKTYLRSKYADEPLVAKLIAREFWKGQTTEQLKDSLGPPVAVDDKLLKTIKREIWKYNQHGKNRYRLRITVEEDLVVGWDNKK